MSSNIKNKLLQHEVVPPKGVWDRIAKKLDEDQEQQFAEKMTAHEEAPPAMAWGNISKMLDEEAKQSKVVAMPPRKIFTTVYSRIAVAASIAAIITITVVSVSKNKNEKPSNITAGIETKNNSNTSTATLPKNNTETAAVQQHGQPTGPIVQVGDIATIESDPIAPLVKNPFDINKAEKIKNSSGDIVTDMDQFNLPNSYQTFVGPFGSRQVSAKLYPYLKYLGDKVDTEENLDRLVKESAIWQKKLQLWSDIMATNAATPMDILEISNFLEQK